MTSTSTRTLALFAGLALVACGAREEPAGAVPAVDQTVQAASQRPAVPVLDWVPCGEEFPGTECAVAEVPLDYDRPRGETTFIALARIPAADQAHKVGSVFINPGGPGGSAVDVILFNFEGANDLATRLGGRFDVVGFDPRGVRRSDPLLCFDSIEESNAWMNEQFNQFPIRDAEERPYFDYSLTLVRHCLGGAWRIAPHMSTADVARDLDLLRQAVGDQRLTYLGFSYGTYIGETYANLFPNRIRKMVLDGVIDPRIYAAGLHWAVSYPASALEEFDEILRLCDEAGPEHCALTRPGGAAARLQALTDALWERPYELPDGTTITYQGLLWSESMSLYDPSTWGGPDGWFTWFAYLADTVLGDATAAPLSNEALAALRKKLSGSASGLDSYAYDNTQEVLYGVSCADSQYPLHFLGWAALADYATHVSKLATLPWWNMAPCANWPVARDRYIGPWEARTSAPVLVVGNYFDGVTSYNGAVATSRLLKNSRLLSYAGWGHTAWGIDECATEHMARYLADGTLPPEGTVCPAPPNPFVPTAALRSVRPAGKPMVWQPPLRWHR